MSRGQNKTTAENILYGQQRVSSGGQVDFLQARANRETMQKYQQLIEQIKAADFAELEDILLNEYELWIDFDQETVLDRLLQTAMEQMIHQRCPQLGSFMITDKAALGTEIQMFKQSLRVQRKSNDLNEQRVLERLHNQCFERVLLSGENDEYDYALLKINENQVCLLRNNRSQSKLWNREFAAYLANNPLVRQQKKQIWNSFLRSFNNYNQEFEQFGMASTSGQFLDNSFQELGLSSLLGVKSEKDQLIKVATNKFIVAVDEQIPSVYAYEKLSQLHREQLSIQAITRIKKALRSEKVDAIYDTFRVTKQRHRHLANYEELVSSWQKMRFQSKKPYPDQAVGDALHAYFFGQMNESRIDQAKIAFARALLTD